MFENMVLRAVFGTIREKRRKLHDKIVSISFTIYYQVDPIEGKKQVGHAEFVRDVTTNAYKDFVGNT